MDECNMKPSATKSRRRGTILLMIVGLLAMLFVVVSAYIVLARFDRQALGFVRQGTQVSRIIDSIHDVLAAEIRGPRTTPGASVTGAAYVDTPAYYDGTVGAPGTKVRGAPWLASPEPVRDPNGSTWPEDYSYPVVTGASGNVSGKRALTGLMWDASDAVAGEGVAVRPGDPNYLASMTAWPDTIANAREPFMDADGDGIADSYFGSVSVLTELANALVGRSLRANITPEALNWHEANPDANRLAWQQFSELARYTVAAKIVSHGGMVQVSSPTDGFRWNNEFLGNMFNWVAYPGEGPLAPRYNATHRTWLFDMWAQRGAVEPFLRRRGGLLAGYDGTTDRGVPPALWTLQNNFPFTFIPQYGFLPQYGTKEDNWQRFNLASLNEWSAWRRAATIDPVDYNTNPNVRRRWVPRQVLTTVNNSDELAREQGKYVNPVDPNNSLEFSPRYWDYRLGTPPAWLWPGIEPGALKYYLGRIRGAFDPVQMRFLTTGTSNEILRDMVSYFCEMLAGHKDFPDLDPNTPLSDNERRLQQAYMLAVNTVAFAAPHGANQQVDAVWTDDLLGNRYIGYAPQPFITQVVAYNAPDTDPNNPNPARVALAVELYIPHDSAVPHPESLANYALDLQYFGLSINDNFIPGNQSAAALAQLAGRTKGRTFTWYSVHSGNNAFFDWHNPNGKFTTFSVPYEADGQAIKVKLWRQSFSLGWYLVDEIEVETEDPGGVGLPRNEQWYVNLRRDTSWEPYLGRWEQQQTGAPARWRMAVGFQPEDPEYKQLHTVVRGSSPDPIIVQLRSGIDDPFPAFSGGIQKDWGSHDLCAIGGYPLGPAVPLHLMNAGADFWPTESYANIHGTKRPASFPTVGFMLFVPRLSHMVTSGGERKPMSRLLRDSWKDRYSLDPNNPTLLPLPPVDFGHMPIFDNTQDVHAGAQKVVGEFADTGRIPWGLLVFDYFTTLNPNDADSNGTEGDRLDPYRVEGRININAAPWYVLAGLPLLGPDRDDNLGISQDASAAFWSKKSGGLVGRGADGIDRYPSSVLYRGDVNNGQWYRLGPWLAQSIAAYRDRVQYVNVNADPPLAGAFYRSGYRPGETSAIPRYGLIRGYGQLGGGVPVPSEQWKRGLLTVGELANVMGFDSSVLPGDTWPMGLGAEYNPVLGPYTVGANYYQLGGDFMKAVSLLALLDTQFLTTRSNTFTVYLTLTDRQDPQASVRSQVTIDRSNLLPRLLPGYDSDRNGYPDTFITQEDSGLPETVGQREVSYFNARYDE
jgi:hypothetical protein